MKTAASSRSMVFHQRLHNIEEFPQWNRGFQFLRCSRSSHQNPGPTSTCRFFCKALWRFILKRSVEGPSSHLFSPFVSDRFPFSASFSRTCVTVLLSVCPPFFVSAIAAPTFYGPWVQCERSPANIWYSCKDLLWLIRTAAAFRLGARQIRSMPCKRMQCKAVSLIFNFPWEVIRCSERSRNLDWRRPCLVIYI